MQYNLCARSVNADVYTITKDHTGKRAGAGCSRVLCTQTQGNLSPPSVVVWRQYDPTFHGGDSL